MTGVKIALGAVGIITGGSTTLTGLIIAQSAPAPISADSHVNVTLALVGSGLATVAVLSWKVSRAWSKIESQLIRAEERIKHLEKLAGESSDE